MAGKEVTRNYGEKIIEDFVRDNTRTDGESTGYSGPNFGGLMSFQGQVDPENREAVLDAIKKEHPDWYAKTRDQYAQLGLGSGGKISGEGANDTLTFTSGEDSAGSLGEWGMLVSAFAAPILGPSMGLSKIEAAIAKAGISIATGQDPITALVNGGLSTLTGSIFGEANATLGENSFDTGAMNEVLTRTPDVVGTGTGNVVASTGGIVNDASVVDAPSTAGTPSAENYAEAYPGSSQGTGGLDMSNSNPASYKPGGIIDGFMKMVNGMTPQQATLAGALGAGALGVVGGIGSALLNKDTAEKRIQADKDLLAQKTTEEQKAAENKRAMIQSGSYFDAKIGVAAPTTPRPLRRPNGALVYAQPGIVAGAMQGPR